MTNLEMKVAVYQMIKEGGKQALVDYAQGKAEEIADQFTRPGMTNSEKEAIGNAARISVLETFAEIVYGDASQYHKFVSH